MTDGQTKAHLELLSEPKKSHSTNTNANTYIFEMLPLYNKTKAVCLLKIVPRKFSLKSLKNERMNVYKSDPCK